MTEAQAHNATNCGLAWTHPDTVKDMKILPGLNVTFSWKRALGITAAKRKVARATGIPLTKAGRQRKLGKMLGMK